MKDYYRFILFFVLGWIMFSIISCTTVPIHKQVIRHGVIDYYELVEPLGTKHLYRTEPLIDKTYYCLIHEVPEVIYRLDTDNILTKRVRKFNWIVD